MFACVLVFMQLGFRSALFDSATALLQNMRADVFLMHPLTTASFRPETFPRARASQGARPAGGARRRCRSTWRRRSGGTRRTASAAPCSSSASTRKPGVMDFPGLGPWWTR
jgi:putative ABC transport system permease protein